MPLIGRTNDLRQSKLSTLLKAESRTSYFDKLLEALDVSEEAAWTDAFGKALRSWIEQIGQPHLRTLSLFTGAGGLDAGFHDAGFDLVSMVEIDPKFVDTLRKNRENGYYFEGSQIFCGDIGSFEPNSDFDVDLVIGGPPCQAFSAAGRRVAGAPGLKDPRGELYKEFIRILAAVRPKAFLFENVYGLTGVSNGETWRVILSDFEELGYQISHRILDAADYGVPQHRERLIVVGVRGLQFLFPKPTHGPDSPDQHPYYTPRGALLDLNEEEKPSLVGGRWGHLLRNIPPGLNYSFYTAKMGNPQALFAWRSKFSDFLYKADPHMPVRAIKASGGQYTGPFHWENRPFSVAELKRLQTIPDDYLIVGSRQAAIKQIGNAVPPQLGRILALGLLSQAWNMKFPVELEFLAPNNRLNFRSRKRAMTKIYRKKAAKAIARLKSFRADKDETTRYNTSYSYWAKINLKDFNWLVDAKENPRLFVNVNASGRSLSIQVKTKDYYNETAAGRFAIIVRPSRLGWDIPFQEVELVGYPLGSEVFVGLWKALECYLAEVNLKADLVQLCGYYQYPPRLKADITFSSENPVTTVWGIVKKVVEGVTLRQILPLKALARLWKVSIMHACSGLKQLRLLGYEVRGHSTNVRIPENHFLVPYCFPTLNPLSVQLRKNLEVKMV